MAVATLIGLFATALAPGIASALSFAAQASISPKVQYVGDSAGTTFTLKVKNTGTVRSIGAVRVTRPTSFWTVTGCPTGPSGWSRTAAADSCTYLSPSGSSGNIARNHTATFTFKTTTAPSIANRAGTWTVTVTTLDAFSDPSWIKQAGAMGAGLNTKAYSFEVSDFVVAASPATVGDPCPSPNKQAAPGATDQVMVVCGTNHTNAGQLLKNAYGRLTGTLAAAHGLFSSATVAAGASDVVLGNWATVTIAGGSGTKTVSGRVGAFSGRTSPPTLITGYALDDVAPVATDEAYYISEEDVYTASTSVLANDTDGNGDSLTAVQDTGPGHAQSFTLNLNGTFSYTPTTNYCGTDSFTYHANDGALDSNIATASIHVACINDAPVAVNDNGVSYTINEDNPLTITTPGVLGNDTDVDLDPLTSILNLGPTHSQSFALSANGSFNYTAALNYNGTDTFTYKANDGTADSNIATVTITINAVNDAPVAVDDEITTTQGTGFSYTAANGLRTDVTDPDGDTQTISRVTDVASGSVTVNSDGSFSYSAPTVGDFSFTWKSNDGTVDSNTVTMTIHVVAPGGGGGGGGGGGCLVSC